MRTGIKPYAPAQVEAFVLQGLAGTARHYAGIDIDEPVAKYVGMHLVGVQVNRQQALALCEYFQRFFGNESMGPPLRKWTKDGILKREDAEELYGAHNQESSFMRWVHDAKFVEDHLNEKPLRDRKEYRERRDGRGHFYEALKNPAMPEAFWRPEWEAGAEFRARAILCNPNLGPREVLEGLSRPGKAKNAAGAIKHIRLGMGTGGNEWARNAERDDSIRKGIELFSTDVAYHDNAIELLRNAHLTEETFALATETFLRAYQSKHLGHVINAARLRAEFSIHYRTENHRGFVEAQRVEVET